VIGGRLPLRRGQHTRCSRCTTAILRWWALRAEPSELSVELFNFTLQALVLTEERCVPRRLQRGLAGLLGCHDARLFVFLLQLRVSIIRRQHLICVLYCFCELHLELVPRGGVRLLLVSEPSCCLVALLLRLG
jgi:hypothetical protein